jgi:formylglycine-generating enzyme required for sulfatase activity
MVEQAVKRFRRGKPAKPRDAVVRSLVPEERQVRLGWLREEECAARRRWSPQLGGVLQRERASFCACPPEGWQHPSDPTRDRLEFDMGSPEYGDEQPRHRVRLPGPVWLGRGPVTNRQYELFDAGHAREAEWQSASDRLDEHPVVNVSHHQAALFCRWLTGTGANGRYRLPTEVEWEFGCRAGRDGEGERYGVGDGRELTHADANFGYDEQRTTVVGTYAPNAWGLCDTHGNVWEWCADWYDKTWYQQRASAGGPPWPGDTGPPVGSFRVLRGGSWVSNDIRCRAAFRLHRTPEDRDDHIGFRVSWGGE